LQEITVLEKVLPFAIDLALTGAPIPIEIRAGMSTIIVGANGSGKTKLAMECERQLSTRAHRISAQRMLALDPSIEKVGEEDARSLLRFGYAKPEQYGGPEASRNVNRWGQSQPRFILNDAGALLQVLFAEQANTAVRAYNTLSDGGRFLSGETFLRKLKAIFHRVLPTRRLEITADNISVSAVGDNSTGDPYDMTQMSDGEKAVFYMIGQTLVADSESVFIMDEPEIHVHRSILGRLWDELEATRPDCAFLLITHDLEFAASRAGKKYVVRSYAPASGWVIEDVPEAKGFSEELVTLILGSRKPVLFVEGEQASLDLAFYRACYPNWTVVPRGGCEGVIHSVVTMRRNAAFTRVQCAGLVDADGHDEADRASLVGNGIHILPVSEIENILLLPVVSRAILEMNDFDEGELEVKLATLKAAIFADASVEKSVNEVVLGYCRRRIDRTLKQLDFSMDTSIADLAASYTARTTELDISALATERETKIRTAVASGDLPALLAIYDRKKPLLALASSHLRNWKVEVFSAWFTRAIQSTRDDRLRKAIRTVLPEITV
jgi:ABC-type dipeptide/oligopeptide/nickel transport system ATPase component